MTDNLTDNLLMLVSGFVWCLLLENWRLGAVFAATNP